MKLSLVCVYIKAYVARGHFEKVKNKGKTEKWTFFNFISIEFLIKSLKLLKKQQKSCKNQRYYEKNMNFTTIASCCEIG